VARLILHCARLLPEWASDDAENTRLVHDTRAIVTGANTARLVQEARQARDPREPGFDELSGAQRAALTSRVASVQASRAAFEPPFGNAIRGR
jgi:hypothetical protein